MSSRLRHTAALVLQNFVAHAKSRDGRGDALLVPAPPSPIDSWCSRHVQSRPQLVRSIRSIAPPPRLSSPAEFLRKASQLTRSLMSRDIICRKARGE